MNRILRCLIVESIAVLSLIFILIILFGVINQIISPGWILASQVGSTSHPERIIKTTRKDLEEYPSIIEALYLADTCTGVHPTRFVECSYFEGMRIVNPFGKQYTTQRNGYWLHLDIDGHLYSVSLLFVKYPPPIV